MRVRRELHLLNVVLLVDAIAMGVLLPLLPFLMLDMGASPTQVTSLAAIYGLSAFLGAPLIGRIADRIGDVRTLQLCLLGMGLSYTGMAFQSSIIGLFMFRSLTGCFSSIDPVAQSRSSKLVEPKEIAATLGTLSGFRAIGLIVGPLAAGAVAFFFGRGANYFQVCMFLSAAFSFASFLIACMLVADSRSPKAPNEKAKDSPQVFVRGGARFESRSLVVPIVSILVLSVLVSIPFGIAQSVAALYVDEVFGWGTTETGLLLGLCALSVVVARFFLVRRFVATFRQWGTLRLSFLLASVALATILIFQGSAFFVASYAVFFVGYATALVCTSGLLSAISSGQHRGVILGWNHAAFSLAVVVGAMASGHLFQYFGNQAAFLVALMCVVLGLVWSTLAKRFATLSLDA